MADQRNGGIAWTDQSWNPIRGCSKVSEGCRYCYAMLVAARFSGPGQPYEGLAERDPARWTGTVQLVEEHLTDPLRWTRPRRVFVNSMSDLFHPALPDEAIDRVFAVMALAGRHTFQVLTKRPERMRDYMQRRTLTRGEFWPRAIWERMHDFVGPDERWPHYDGSARWPLPNVWLGVSVEDQARADERIPLLLETPAAVRFISAEPLLGPLDLLWALGADVRAPAPASWNQGVQWVIVGGESGPGARPCDVAWVRDIVRQCREAGTACFVKQLGANIAGAHDRIIKRHGGYAVTTTYRPVNLRDRKGGDPSEWPADLRVREFPAVQTSATEAG